MATCLCVRPIHLAMFLVLWASTSAALGDQSGFSAVVYREGTAVFAEDGAGARLAEGLVETDSTRVIQAAVQACGTGGEVRIRAGKYHLSAPIVIDMPCTLSGEGRATVLVPPPDEFAVRIMRTDRSPTINDWVWASERDTMPEWLIDLCGKRLYGVHVRDLAIVGMGQGKGIYLNEVTECSCSNLAIHGTCDGAAVYADTTVMESIFRDIVCYVNGSVKNREATFVIASQDTGDANNNLVFDRIHALLPNYVGVQVGTDKAQHPRLIYFTKSFFHGWLPLERTAPYDLFLVHGTFPHRGVFISESRFTITQEDKSLLHVRSGAVRVTGCSFDGGPSAAVTADPGAKLVLSESFFQDRTHGPAAVTVRGADAVINGNSFGEGQRVFLDTPRSAIISGNRFYSPETDSLGIAGIETTGPRLQVLHNVFEEQAAAE
jgi:hypothetical protein